MDIQSLFLQSFIYLAAALFAILLGKDSGSVRCSVTCWSAWRSARGGSD
ncbi:MAG: hypothetical protein OSA84_07840 [Akkermansiaceae bacterium]|nr:hypothetical protein [Akkermansiaceae bacterium]